MTSFNRVIIAGNLVRDPQLRTAGSSQVASFGLAVNRTWKDRDGQKQEEVTFVDIECWGRTAELVSQYLSKGRGCLVEGRLKLDVWEDKDGNKRSKLKVVAESVQFIGGREGGGGDGVQARAAETAGAIDDETPF